MKSIILPLHRLSARVLHQQLGEHVCIQHWHILYHVLDGQLGTGGDPHLKHTEPTVIYVSDRLHRGIADNTSRAAELIYLHHVDSIMHYVMGRHHEIGIRASIAEWCAMHHVTDDDINLDSLYRTWTRWRGKYLTNVEHRQLVKPIKRRAKVAHVRHMSTAEADQIAGSIIIAAAYYFTGATGALLPNRCQRIRIYLYYHYCGLPHKSISRLLHINYNTVKSMCSTIAHSIHRDHRLSSAVLDMAGEVPTVGRGRISLG